MVSIDKFKLSSVTWDSDKNPTGFTKWMNDFGSLVASTEHGAILEAFLDQKLGREKHLATTVPSYISKDDDFAAGKTQKKNQKFPLKAPKPQKPRRKKLSPPQVHPKWAEVSSGPRRSMQISRLKRRHWTECSITFSK